VHWPLQADLGAPLEALLVVPAGIAAVRSWRTSSRAGRLHRRLVHAAWRGRGARRLGQAAVGAWLVGEADPLQELAADRRVILKTWARFVALDEGFTWLEPAPQVRERLERAWATLGDRPRVGVHIRRGDHALAIARTPTDAFFRRMDELVRQDGTTAFLVATDDAAVEDEARRRFPGRVAVLPKRGRDRVATASVQDALVDLLALARCTAVLGTYASTFGKTAAEHGRIPYEVVGTGARWVPGEGPMIDPPDPVWLARQGRPGGAYDGVRRGPSTASSPTDS
jgi:hypothetical protein